MILAPDLAEQLAKHERVERHARIRAACCDEHGPGINVDEHARLVAAIANGPCRPRFLPSGHHAARTRELLERSSRR